MSKQTKYDNTNSGALFPTSDKGILSGPWQFDEKEPKHMLVSELGDQGGEHTLRVHERKKDQSAGKLAGQGTFRATKSDKGPVARGTIVSKKYGEIRVCLWKQAGPNGTYFQVKPDTFEPREVPQL